MQVQHPALCYSFATGDWKCNPRRTIIRPRTKTNKPLNRSRAVFCGQSPRAEHTQRYALVQNNYSRTATQISFIATRPWTVSPVHPQTFNCRNYSKTTDRNNRPLQGARKPRSTNKPRTIPGQLLDPLVLMALTQARVARHPRQVSLTTHNNKQARNSLLNYFITAIFPGHCNFARGVSRFLERLANLPYVDTLIWGAHAQTQRPKPLCCVAGP